MPVRVPIAIPDGAERAGRVDAAELRKLVRAAVRATLKRRGVREAEISVTLMDDAGMSEMNREYLQRDRVTDVIAFPLYEEGEAPVGDVYIGYEQALRQAAAHGVRDREEVTRLVVHGTLHVLGYDHPETGARERSEMWRLQEQIVAELAAKWPGRAR